MDYTGYMYLVGLIVSTLALWYLLILGGSALEARDLLPESLGFIYVHLSAAWYGLLSYFEYALSFFL